MTTDAQGQVRAMAEQDDDARVQEIRAEHAQCPYRPAPYCIGCGQREDCQVLPLLARLDALAAEASDVARENEALIEEVKASGEQIAALADERDARIKTLENDLEHALASVGAFRQAIETIFEKADEHEVDQGGMIVTYVLPCGPLHRAIGLARGTDAGGKLLAERDALRARAERAEAALAPCTLALEYRDGVTCREERDKGVCLNHRVIAGLRVHAVTADRLEIENRALRRQVRATYGIIHEGMHGGKPTDPEHQETCEMPSCRNARAALAAASEGAQEGCDGSE